MKLYFDDHDLDVNVKTIISSKTKNEFIDKIQGLQDDPINLEAITLIGDREIELSKEEQSTGKVNLGKMLQYANLNKKFTPEIQKSNDLIFIDCFKIIFDPKQLASKALTAEEQKSFNTSPESEFWQNQDIISIQSEVIGFCQLLKK